MAGATRSPARMAAWSKGRRSSTCNKCTNNIKGGMTHLLWECPYYQQIRTKFKPIYAQNLVDWVHPKSSDKDNDQLSLLNFMLKAKLDVYVQILSSLIPFSATCPDGDVTCHIPLTFTLFLWQ